MRCYYRALIWLYAAVLILTPGITAVEESAETEKEFVLTLDHSNFSDAVSNRDFIVVEFYAPWCGHCKNLAPEYEKAASILSSHDPPVVLAKVDANEAANMELASKYDVNGFPTIKILRKGGKSIQEYKGPGDAEGIVDYLKKQIGPVSSEIRSSKDASDLIGGKKIVVVGVFPRFSGQEYENYIAVAEKLRSDFEFHHTLDAKHLPRGESSVTGPLVRLFKPFDELFVDFKDFNVDVLEKFVEESSMPIVTVFNGDPSNHVISNFSTVPKPRVWQLRTRNDTISAVGHWSITTIVAAMLFFNFSSAAIDSFRSKYQDVAEQYKGQGIIFLMGDVTASQNAFQYFGLKEEQAPLLIVQNTDGQKYLKPNLEPGHIAAWVKEYKDGKVLPYRKSEPIPEANNEPVKVVVADSLQDMVFNTGKKVLLEFYAPWCGHCMNLAPILDEVAVSYGSDPYVLIAKLDATANDYPNDTFDVKGYPTMYFKSASGNLVQYDGDRTKEAIVDFIEKNRDNSSTKRESDKAIPKQESAQDEL